MRILFISAAILFLGCNGNQQSQDQNQITVVKEDSAIKHSVPEFTGTIDSLTLKTIMTHYFTVKNALIDGNTKAASVTGKEAAKILPAGNDIVFTQISENFKRIGETDDIEVQRKYFYPLSEYLYAVTSKIKPDTTTLYKQYCPMAFDDAGAWWISDEAEVVNPYFGEEMLHCGMVQKQW